MRRVPAQKRQTLTVAIGLALAGGLITGHAATLNVTTTDLDRDNGDGCSLLEAIDNANADMQIHADCPAGNGRDTVSLMASSILMFSTTDEVGDGNNGLPIVTSDIQILGNQSAFVRGAGCDLNTPDDPSKFRFLEVSGPLSLSDVTLSGGCVDDDGPGSGNGGAILVNSGGTLSLSSVGVSSSSAAGAGGGLYLGGGAEIRQSELSNNSASAGGGIASSLSTMAGPSALIVNSTLSGNTADIRGGAIRAIGGYLQLTNVTVTANTATSASGISSDDYAQSRVLIRRSIVSANAGNADFEVFPGMGDSPFINELGNVVGSLVFQNGDYGSDVNVTDPGLGSLSDNGGPTRTHAVLAGSLAIDAGNTFCDMLLEDQRGQPRLVDGNEDMQAECDAGAYERADVGPTTDLSISISDGLDVVSSGELLTYAIRVENSGPEAVVGANVETMLASGLINAAWTCTPDTGADCAESGVGEINQDVDIPVGSFVEFTLMAQVDPTFAGASIASSVVVTEPMSLVDENRDNNSAIDITLLDEVFADGFETTVVAAAYAKRRVLLDLSRHNLNAASVLVAQGSAPEAGAFVQVYARRTEQGVEVRIQQLEAGTFRVGNWVRTNSSTVDVRW